MENIMRAEILKIEGSHYPLFDKFIDLPEEIYRDDQYYVTPLKKELLKKLDKTKNPFFSYAQIQHYLAVDESGKVQGRVSLIDNPEHNRIHNEQSCFFG